MKKMKVSKATVLTIINETGVAPPDAWFDMSTEDQEILTYLHGLFVDYAQIKRVAVGVASAPKSEHCLTFYYSIGVMLTAELTGNREVMGIPINRHNTYNDFKELILDYYSIKSPGMYDIYYGKTELEQAVITAFPPATFDGEKSNWDIPMCPELAGNTTWVYCLFK